MDVRYRPFIAFLLALLPACLRGGDASPLRVIALHPLLEEIAREVGDAEALVTPLLRPGADPHHYEPSPTDLRRLADARLILAAGLGLEGYLPRLAAEFSDGRVVEVGRRLPGLIEVEGHDHDHGHARGHDHDAHDHGSIDPHWWHGHAQVLGAVDVVAGEFSRLRPEGKSRFSQNAARFRARVRAAHGWAVAELKAVPPGQRKLVTPHDAFAYFARDHGFKVYALAGPDTGGEPNARTVAAIVNLIRREKVKAIFSEGGAPSRLIEAVRRETGVTLGGILDADGAGLNGRAPTFESMLRHNVETIVSALR